MSESRFPWRTLLFISLAVNLLVIGAVAGAVVAGVRVQRENPEAVVARMPGVRAFMVAVPAEARPAVRRELVRSWQESRDARQAAIQARRDAFAATTEEPFDAERVRAAFARLREADQAAIGVFHDNMIDAFATLTPEQRQSTIEALRAAAPAARPSLMPAEDGAAGAPVIAPGLREQREPLSRDERRERLRERLRERRAQQREQQDQAAPTP
jgi:uncharacterized membrane protein